MSFPRQVVQYTESLVFSVLFLLLVCCVTAVIAASCSEYLHKRRGRTDRWREESFNPSLYLVGENYFKIFALITEVIKKV